ncbi:MAG: transposase [Thermodesulfobacteriota bacterium]
MRPDFSRRIQVDFPGATLSSDTGFLPLRDIDERFGIIEGIGDALAETRSPSHNRHSIVQMIRQRVYRMAAGYEDRNDADFLSVDPALRLSLDKDADFGASQSMLSRMENYIPSKGNGLKALDEAILRSAKPAQTSGKTSGNTCQENDRKQNTDSLVKSRKTTFHSAGEGFPLPPLEVNSSSSTLTPVPPLAGLFALGLMTDFLQVRQYWFGS